MKVRAKRIQISPDALIHIMKQDTAWRVSEGIPVGARLRGLTLDPYTQILNLFVEHESFPEVDIGNVIPILTTEFKRIS